MRRIVRTGILLAFLVIGIGAAVVAYVNSVMLPVKVRAQAQTLLSQAIGRQVTIGRLRLHPWHGFLAEEIRIEEDARYGKTPFFKIDRISGGILILPLLKNREVLIPILRISRPQCRLIRDSDGLWNTQSLKLTFPASPATGRRWHLVVPAVVVTDGLLEVDLQDSAQPHRFSFDDLDLKVNLALPAHIHGVLTTRFLSNPPSRLSLEGTYDLKNREIRLKNQAAIPLSAVTAYLPQGLAAPIDHLKGTASLILELVGKHQGPFAVTGSLRTEGLTWKIRHPLPQTLLGESAPWLNGQGEVQAQWKGPLTLSSPALFWSALSGTVDLGPISLGPFPTIDELRQLTGRVNFSPKGIWTDELTALIPTGQALALRGSIANDKNKSILVKLITHSLVERLPALPPKVQALVEKAKPSGQVTIEASGEGTLAPTVSIRPTVNATFRETSLNVPGLDPFQGIAGTIRWQPDLLTVTGLDGSFREKPFHLEGSLVNFALPEIDAQLSWGLLAAQMQLKIDGHRMEIESLSGRYGQAPFRLLGEVTGPVEMNADLYAETTFQAEDLPTLWPQCPSWVKEEALTGPVSARFLLKGPLFQPARWNFGWKGSSTRLSSRTWVLENCALDLRAEEGHLSLTSLKSDFAGGSLFLEGSLDATQGTKPWKGRVSADAVELAFLAQQFHWKTQDLSGRFSLECTTQGEGADWKKVEGNGSAQVRGGKIVELPFLGRFADMLKLPTLRTIAFEAAEGSFTLHEGSLQTESFQLKAPQATLVLMGKGGFLQGLESPISWRILPTFSSELIPEEARQGLGKVIAKGTSYFMGEIRVSGTWKEPKHTFVPKKLTQILNEQIFNLEDFFKRIF